MHKNNRAHLVKVGKNKNSKKTQKKFKKGIDKAGGK